MRWYNKLRLVFRIYSRRMFVTLLLFGMCFVSFFMIDRVFTGYIGSRYAIRQTEKEFGVNTADAGYVHFVTRDIKQEKEIAISGDDVVIIEGLHGLNPLLTQRVGEDKVTRIFASVGR